MGRHGSQRAGEGLDLLARVRRLPPPRPGGVDAPGLFTPRARGPDRPLLEPAAAVRAGVVKDVFHAGGTEGAMQMQIRASADSGGRSLSQSSQFGRSSRISICIAP